jgi:hypothetical protein
MNEEDRIVLKWILKKYEGIIGTVFIWIRTETIGGFL